MKTMISTFLCLVAFIAVASVPTSIRAETPSPSGIFGQVEGSVSIFNDVPDRGLVAPGVGYSGMLGYRVGDWGAFLHVGHSMWVTSSTDASFRMGALNTGLGGEVRFLDDRVRSSLSLGMSTLLFDAPLDDAGSVGWYINVRPLGLRWDLFEAVSLELNPLSFLLMRPDSGGVGQLTRVEYQTTLAVEFH